ncbi:phage major capsid protein [Sinorhizobium meliloti]|uniref:Phage major capsid protein, HK97 n=1 Tax=Sinorhizobium meliloti (strain SM11) TaxID=707241 RepID=F7X3G0_SINMM|nr:phage major capsid protein [Sinorhizobium meliloti]AEH78364.1 phage major capsid protein, HK97 [Sinorhizobium meliloti SM11]MBP2465893.1 HK97 family phage major capsid protein [Sinorhizobium meliloti]MBP2466566.1 HK97 family phage major capsid protein [Sinorhizobium meliloti]MDE3768636.1 phage major capsid protein [Sinorhizobium meliloti]MDE3769326.1 phage major capsid protein [Sinorhizobium meliloti]
MPDPVEKTAEQLALEVKAEFDKTINQVKEIAEKALAEAAKGVGLTDDLKEKADESLLKMNALTEQVADIEQKLARGGGNKNTPEKTIGEQFVEDQGVKDWAQSSPSKGKADVRFKATITSATTDTAGAAGAAVETTRLPGILALPQRRLTVRGLISPGRMDGNSLEYVRETGFTNSAAPVAETAAKPESDLKFDLVTTSAKVIAHWMKASRQILDDFSQLRSIIDQRLLYGLAYVEEGQLLNGDGTGQNLHGIIPQATAYAAAFTPDAPTAIDTLRLAQLQAALAEYPATGHVMNPTDWARIELEKDTTGRYIIGNPQGMIGPTLWGLPVVATQAIAVDKFLTGAFRLGAQLFDRWDARVEAGFVNDDFIKNLVTILAEERLALAVYRPEAFIYGDLGYVA